MICQPCKLAAVLNRHLIDKGEDVYLAHPENCACGCQHTPLKEWDAQYSVPRPERV